MALLPLEWAIFTSVTLPVGAMCTSSTTVGLFRAIRSSSPGDVYLRAGGFHLSTEPRIQSADARDGDVSADAGERIGIGFALRQRVSRRRWHAALLAIPIRRLRLRRRNYLPHLNLRRLFLHRWV